MTHNPCMRTPHDKKQPAAQRNAKLLTYLLRCLKLRSGGPSACGCSATSRRMTSYVVKTMSAAASCAAVTTSLLTAALPPAAVTAAAPRASLLVLTPGLLLLLLLLRALGVAACACPAYTLIDRLPGMV